MARLQFRITNVAFDEAEDPAAITAVVRDDAYEVITGILGEVDTRTVARGGTEMTVVLPIEGTRKLFAACGDPRYGKGVHEIYESLTMVFYGIMQE